MSQGLTVKERERLEATIKEEVDSQVEFYKKWRAEQKQEVYKSVKATSEKADKSALEAFKKAMAGLKALGYEFRTSYRDDDVTAVKEICNAKELTEFDKDTDSTAEKLKSIKRRTLMKLYTATGDNDILNEMIAEITKVIGEPARKTCPRPNALIPVRGGYAKCCGTARIMWQIQGWPSSIVKKPRNEEQSQVGLQKGLLGCSGSRLRESVVS